MKDQKEFATRNTAGSFDKPVMGKGLDAKGPIKKKMIKVGGLSDDNEEALKKGKKPVKGDIGENLDEALELINEEIKLDPQNEELHKQRYQVLKKIGDKQALTEALEEATGFSLDPFFATKLGELWEERFDYEKALVWRKRVVDLKGDDPYVVKRLAIAYVRTFKFDRAEETYDKIFKMQPEAEDVLGHTFFQEMQGIGLPKERRKDVQDFGLKVAKKALEYHPNSISILEGAARLARVARDSENAIRFYENLLSKKGVDEHSSYRQWKTELLRIYAREGLDEKWKKLNTSIIEDYKSFLSKFSSDSNAWLQLGLQQIQAGEFEDAIESLKRSISVDEKNVQALYELGRVLVRLDRKEEAVEYYLGVVPSSDELSSRMKYHRSLELCLGELYYKLGKYDEALAIYKREEHSNMRFIGTVLEAMESDEEALAAYNSAIDISPRDGRTYLALTEYCVRRNQWEEAEHNAKKGIECPHNNRETTENLYVALATTKMKTNQIDEALKIMEDAREASPDLLNMDLRRMKLLFLKGRAKDAKMVGEELVRRLEKQLRCAPSASELWSLLGDSCSLLGIHEKAKDAYTQAMRFNAMESEAVRGMGVLAEKYGEYEKAIELFRKFTVLEPLSLSTPPLKEKIRQLSEKKDS